MDNESISPGSLFSGHVCSLQSPILLAVLLIGITMLSESFQQKVQEKGGMERKITVSIGATSALWKKKDVPVVSFNLVRPAGVLMYAVCSFCCYTPNRQLGYLVGLCVRAEVCILASLLASGC